MGTTDEWQGLQRKMKLLFVHQNLGEFGGAEANIHLTAKELQRRGHTVALLHRHNTGRNEKEWRETFSHCFSLNGDGRPEALEAVLEQFEPDLVYLHNFADLPVLEALFEAGVPVVRMVHDHSLYCMRSYKYNFLTRKICHRAASASCVFPCLATVGRNRNGGFPLKWVSYSQKQQEIRLNRQSDHLIVYSDYLKEELVRNGFEARKISLCVPIRIESDQTLLSNFSPQNLVLFAGQIIRGKGVDALLRALAKVPVPFRGILLGDGHHRARCEKLCRKLGLADRVKFQGYVLPAELKEYYLQASVFVMSSLWPEPFGMAGPEAMRYGLPVVAFDAGGIREWLRDGHNGYLIPWNNTDQFARRIEELLSNKEQARQMGLRGLQWVQRYDASRQIDGLEGLFQRLARPRLKASPGACISA